MSFFSRLLDRIRPNYEDSDHRVASRINAPVLMVEMGGLQHRARDWSVGGACVSGFAGDITVGDILSGAMNWASSPERKLPFTAEVMRVENGGVIALRWLDLPLDILHEMENRYG